MPPDGPQDPGSVSPAESPEQDAHALWNLVERLVERGFTVDASVVLPSGGRLRISGNPTVGTVVGRSAGGWQGDPLEVARAEARQYREAFSHAQQLRAFYASALARLCGVRTAAPDERERAFLQAQHDLANPPAWDGELRA